MTVTDIRVVSIPVSDQERAKQFYVETLGFDLRNDGPFGEGQRWIEVAPAGARTALALVTWFEQMQPGGITGLVLNCDNIESTYDELAGRGVAFHGPIQREFWGTFASFNDPDGNGWVLAQETQSAP